MKVVRWHIEILNVLEAIQSPYSDPDKPLTEYLREIIEIVEENT